MKKLPLLFALFMMVGGHVWGAEGESKMTVREDKNWGFMVGFGSPYPSILGLSLAHHLNDKWRMSLGYSEIEAATSLNFSEQGLVIQTSKATTYDLGAEYFLMEDQFRPVVGLHAAYLVMEGDLNIQGFHKTGAHAYSNVGLDWMSQGGYQVGLGMNLAFLGSSSTDFYFNTGWYF